MRIAVLVFEFPKISETFILEQITGMIERGHDVQIIARRRGDKTLVHDDVTRFGLLERATYLEDHHRTTTFLASAIRSPLRTLGRIRRRALVSVRDIITLERVLKTHIPDVVHCHFGPNGALATEATAANAIPFATTYHGIDLTSVLAQEGASFYARLFRRGTIHLPVSHRFAETLISAGCPADRVHVQHMGVSLEQLPVARTAVHAAETVRLLSIGRFVAKKGFEVAVRAVLQLRTEGHDVTYTIIGDGPLRSSVQRTIDDANAAAHIRILGWQTAADVRCALRDHDLFVAPSVTAKDGDQEGIPIVLMEAMASGLPVVSTRHSGIAELVEDEQSGLLVREGDADDLARAVAQLIASPAQWSVFGACGRQVIERRFNADTQIERLIERLQMARSEYSKPPPQPSL